MNERDDLRLEVIRLFSEDQAFLAKLETEKRDPRYQEIEETIARPAVFYTHAVWARWVEAGDAPDIVQEYVAWRNATTDRLRAIIAEFGWPTGDLIGSDAAFLFYWLFGHADGDNDWRQTQIGAITEACRKDSIDPRLYAHLRDRIAACAGEPQIYGSVMGPGDEPGTARLYWPLVDSAEEVDARRAELGLPPMEDDLAKFRDGATIGMYMTPTFVDETAHNATG